MSAGRALNVAFVHADRATVATTTAASNRLVKLEHRHERLLGNLDRAHPLHPPLPFLLLLEEFALAGDVAPVALGKHVLAHRGDGLARDHLAADGGLDGHLVELAGDDR